MYKTSEHAVRFELLSSDLSEEVVESLICRAKSSNAAQFTDACPDSGVYKFVCEDGVWKDNIPHYDDFAATTRSSKVLEDVCCGECFYVADSLSERDTRVGKTFQLESKHESTFILRNSLGAKEEVASTEPWVVSIV